MDQVQREIMVAGFDDDLQMLLMLVADDYHSLALNI